MEGATSTPGVALATPALLALVVLLVSAAAPATAAGGRAARLTGRLVAVHADPRLGEHTAYYLKTGHRHVRLRFRTAPAIRSQARVEVSGRLVAGALKVKTASVTAAAPATATTGSSRLLAILVAWPGAGLRATQAGAASFLFDPDVRSIASWYREASYGQL